MHFAERIRQPGPFLSVELRPPRADLGPEATIDAWFGLGSAVRRLVRAETPLFFTDNAVGANEEENLHHIVSNLDDRESRGRICPFLTTKHSLEYCLWYADRAVDDGHVALTVLGGDHQVGPPRCLPHAHQLRQRLRTRHPELTLGGWANPHRDPSGQVDYLLAADATLDFYLTQVVSHHDLAPVERFVDETRRRAVAPPGVFGVFYYRSANPRTLEALARFLPVPSREIRRDFEERGLDADAVCARTLRALRGIGVTRVYLSNLPPDEATERLAALRDLVDSG